MEKDDSSEVIHVENEWFNLSHYTHFTTDKSSTLMFLWSAMCSMYSWYIPVSIWTFLGSCTCCPQLLQQGIALSWLYYHFYLLGRREKCHCTGKWESWDVFTYWRLENIRNLCLLKSLENMAVEIESDFERFKFHSWKTYSFWEKVDFCSDHMAGVSNSWVILFFPCPAGWSWTKPSVRFGKSSVSVVSSVK